MAQSSFVRSGRKVVRSSLHLSLPCVCGLSASIALSIASVALGIARGALGALVDAGIDSNGESTAALMAAGLENPTNQPAYDDGYGSWISTYAPIRDGDGEVVGYPTRPPQPTVC